MAARDYIKIARNVDTAIHSGLLISYIGAVRHAYELSKRIQGIIDHNNDGTNWSDVETLFGIPAGQGAAAAALIASAIGEPAAKAFSERVG